MVLPTCILVDPIVEQVLDIPFHWGCHLYKAT